MCDHDEAVTWLAGMWTQISDADIREIVDGVRDRTDVALPPPQPPPLSNLAQARKDFYDYLDQHRAWAQPGVNVYEMMAAMVDRAAWFFRGDHRPTKEEVAKLETAIFDLTSRLPRHPEGYDGPCFCPECRES